MGHQCRPSPLDRIGSEQVAAMEWNEWNLSVGISGRNQWNTQKDPFVVFDDYDWRSVIENGIFKEGKNPWHLGHSPQKNEAGVTVHCFFTMAVMALCTAFRLWKAQGAPESRVEGKGRSKAENA